MDSATGIGGGKAELPRKRVRPASDSESLADRAEEALACEDFREALGLFEEALSAAEREDAPQSRRAHFSRCRAKCLAGLGRHREARAAAHEAADLCREDSDQVGEAKAMIEEAAACFHLAEYPAGSRVARASLRVLRHTGENDDLGDLQIALGSILIQQGEGPPALDLFHDALASYRRSENSWGIARAYGHLAVAHKNLGRWDESIRFSERAEEIARELGRNPSSFALNQGIARYWKGDHAGAQTSFFRALGLSQKLGDTARHVRCLLALGRLLRDRGKLDEAEQHLRRAETLAQENNYRRELALAHEYLGDLALDRRDLEEASLRCQQAELLAERVAPGGDLLASILTKQSALALAQNEAPEALSLANRALVAARRSGTPHDEARALIARAHAGHLVGREAEARGDLTEGVRLLRDGGVRFELVRALRETGALVLHDSSPGIALGEATRYLQEATAVLRSLGDTAQLAQTRLDLAELHLRAGETDRTRDELRHLREELAAEEGRLTRETAQRLEEVEQALSRRMGEKAASPDNPFHSLERTGSLPQTLSRAAHPEEELLRNMLETLRADRGFISVGPARGAKKGGIVSRQRMTRREAEAIARRLGRAEEGTKPLAAHPGVSLSPATDSRLEGTSLNGREGVGACLWVRIPRTEGEPALLYADRSEGDGFQPFGQTDLNLAVSLTHLLAVSIDNLELRRALETPAQREGFVTRDEQLLRMFQQVARLGDAAATVLLQGDTGTGKGHLARVVHVASGRGDTPFVTINCADLSENVLESELFGHVKGAFTDAHADHEGLFARADGGTVFIDEIDKTSHKFQTRLLRVVDTREFKPVGDSRSRRLNARIICASNRDLKTEVEEARFLKDLYYRLKVICLTLPPLRERRGDIPLLAQHFLARFGEDFGRTGQRLSPAALDLLISYPWPGNVRDLEHEIERAVVLTDSGGVIVPDSFSDELQDWRRQNMLPREEARKSGRVLAEAVSELEREMVTDALRRTGWNKSRAARILGLTRRGLENKIIRYGIVRE